LPGDSVEFTATPTNVGTISVYQWKLNGSNIQGATNSTYAYAPANNDVITCVFSTNLQCAFTNTATSNAITLILNPLPGTPTAGNHTATKTEITWNWNSVTGATGYKWHTANNYSTAIDMGNLLTKTETGLSCDSYYTRFVWAYDSCGISSTATLTQATLACVFNCGDSITINHIAGEVAPVSTARLLTFQVKNRSAGSPATWDLITRPTR
jgi:hypothetical protein